MKKFFYLIVLCVITSFCVSCSSDVSKSEDLIEKYMELNLGEYDTYKNVKTEIIPLYADDAEVDKTTETNDVNVFCAWKVVHTYRYETILGKMVSTEVFYIDEDFTKIICQREYSGNIEYEKLIDSVYKATILKNSDLKISDFLEVIGKQLENLY